MKDLWGNEIPEVEKPKPGQPKGNPAPIGSGPEGETCKSCDHSQRHAGGTKYFWKCGLVKPTHGPGTDIRLKWAACRFWKKPEQ